MSEMTTVELLIFFLTPLVVVIGVYFLFWSGALGPDLEPDQSNHR